MIQDLDSTNNVHVNSPDSYIVPLPIYSPARKNYRVRKPPLWMQDYTGHLVASSKMDEPTGLSPPIFSYSVSPSLTPSYIEFLFILLSTQEPNSYKEASGSKDWVQSMDVELQALEDKKTWELMPLPGPDLL